MFKNNKKVNIRIIRDFAFMSDEKLTNIVVDTETRRCYATISEPYTIETLSKALRKLADELDNNK